ncbi:MAG: uroporphyrinogen-III C-methyltransferase [Oceanicoccus sp.]|uniref:siroheme synthase CysG n=1 Tax=Oceanicoccus sp. TaxID=2691044 RepID=UPI00262E7B1E|nr:siroheme synthase CysG [Oceanicoccus sp.]MCP3908459.1 uroporphyrinogen-III C-methyltransferase [Oceanicoccus sp.]MDG1773352.1 siroheme synthase CysG [Oceanicoccus sp.]
MDFLPLYFQLKNKPCVIIGGGAVALRKATLLQKSGAIIYIVAHDVLPELEQLVQSTGGSIRIGDYSTADIEGRFLIVAATDDLALNKQVSEDAHQRHVPVNVVDSPELCSVILPAIIDRSPLVIAVSSGGKSPVLARMLRSKIESLVPAAYGRLASLVGGFRDKVKLSYKTVDERKNFWEDVLDGPIAEMVFAGKESVAQEMLAQRLDDDPVEMMNGEVYLVGAGPGDPDLLTFRALRLMQKADVVLYDRLVADQIIDLTRRDAERIYVGKKRSDHAVPQQDINQMLVKLAKEGKRVLRLKGGDPFIFGRGGEEIEELASHNIPFQVVPGITAASGCSSYAGIPLTHRDYAQSVRFVTGHLKNGTADLPWPELVHTKQTLVFYMGLVGLPTICQKLIEYGRDTQTPIALIQQGTTEHQRVLVSTLKEMPEKVVKEQVRPPTLLIVGEVVTLREKLAWFEH